MIVNCKMIPRLMREHGLQPKHCRRFVATTDSDHPDLPRLARDRIIDGPNQLLLATPPTSPSRRALSIWRKFLTPGHAVYSATRSAAPSMRVLALRR